MAGQDNLDYIDSMLTSENVIDKRLINIQKVMSARKVKEVQGLTRERRKEKKADAILKKQISRVKQRKGNVDNPLDDEWSESSEEVSSPKRSSRKSYEEDTNQSNAALTGKRPVKRSFRHSNSVKVHHGGGDLSG